MISFGWCTTDPIGCALQLLADTIVLRIKLERARPVPQRFIVVPQGTGDISCVVVNNRQVLSQSSIALVLKTFLFDVECAL